MGQQEDLQRVLNLAGQVLRRETGYDDALLLANSSHLVSNFVDALNVLSNGDFFSHAEAEDRVRSGMAVLAIQGSIPRFQLPDEVRYWTGQAEPPPTQEIDLLLASLEENLLRALDEEEGVVREIQWKRAIRSSRQHPPKPWIVPVVLSSVGLGVSIGLALGISPAVGAGGTIVTMAVASLVTAQGMKKYQEAMRKILEEDARDQAAEDAKKKTLDEIRQRIHSMRSEASSQLRNMDAAEAERAKAGHPLLFPTDK
ncbi:MAG: hypothetical protein HUU16_10530 [Candidatus Omnitrophica bacterium]|nr:hypothetical protein [bacterium]NUN96597.1 hypothetical protein [Candidatus Omnitrophota bacterium]